MLEQIIAMLVELGDSVSYSVHEDHIDVTVEDFEGFDEDWCEVDAEYDEDAVDGFVEWLEEHCDHHEGDYYHSYYFGELEIEIGYASMDI